MGLSPAGDRLAGNKYTFVHGCSCPDHIFLQEEQGFIGSVPALPMVQSLLHACLHSFCVELPEKYVFGVSYKGVKHKILSLLFMFS